MDVPWIINGSHPNSQCQDFRISFGSVTFKPRNHPCSHYFHSQPSWLDSWSLDTGPQQDKSKKFCSIFRCNIDQLFSDHNFKKCKNFNRMKNLYKKWLQLFFYDLYYCLSLSHLKIVNYAGSTLSTKLKRCWFVKTSVW